MIPLYTVHTCAARLVVPTIAAEDVVCIILLFICNDEWFFLPLANVRGVYVLCLMF